MSDRLPPGYQICKVAGCAAATRSGSGLCRDHAHALIDDGFEPPQLRDAETTRRADEARWSMFGEPASVEIHHAQPPVPWTRTRGSGSQRIKEPKYRTWFESFVAAARRALVESASPAGGPVIVTVQILRRPDTRHGFAGADWRSLRPWPAARRRRQLSESNKRRARSRWRTGERSPDRRGDRDASRRAEGGKQRMKDQLRAHLAKETTLGPAECTQAADEVFAWFVYNYAGDGTTELDRLIGSWQAGLTVEESFRVIDDGDPIEAVIADRPPTSLRQGGPV